MSENFSNQNNSKLANLEENTNCFINECEIGDNKDELSLSYDHMYTSNTENGEIDLAETHDCQSTESEVKFWKEWLILHLDLIQQQSDEILSKERTILILQQENEMLKERISCMERGAPFQPDKFFKNQSSVLNENIDMTHDSNICDQDNKNTLHLVNCDNGDKHVSFELNHNISDSESQTEILDTKFDTQVNFHNINNKIKSENEILNCDDANVGFNFSDNSGEFDPMRNLRMSIRKKRLSNSSVLSNNDSVSDEKRPFQRFKKRRKRVMKDSQVLSTSEQYITEASETNMRMSTNSDLPIDISSSTNLEVPRWRVKVYASCYAMEGTENLDDEVYNKRHSRLENDERRRKRWDVQRIREQRIIEKLKQRQERMGSGSRIDEQHDSIQSLWPKLEDIKFLEVSEELPVSAFGCPLPNITPSEFGLPWLNNSTLPIRKPSRKSGVRRKSSKR